MLTIEFLILNVGIVVVKIEYNFTYGIHMLGAEILRPLTQKQVLPALK